MGLRDGYCPVHPEVYVAEIIVGAGSAKGDFEGISADKVARGNLLTGSRALIQPILTGRCALSARVSCGA